MVSQATPIVNDIVQILDNRILIVAIAACTIAQVLKLIIDVISNGKFSVKVLTTTGGMPSAHSALVTALAAGVGESLGWKSAEFAIATILAVVVMYDAAGVRQAAGKQARILNQMIDELFSDDHKFNEEKLKELLGHTPVQVIAGSVLGIAVNWLFTAIQ
ncbi:divergent PAP2 family protein [Chamaesiphon sp.]|uniref:divergent PAP2 family protein n=1 Tax=Chamaesiphon sp. TaxID=2814140 RepID=UPI003592EB28